MARDTFLLSSQESNPQFSSSCKSNVIPFPVVQNSETETRFNCFPVLGKVISIRRQPLISTLKGLLQADAFSEPSADEIPFIQFCLDQLRKNEPLNMPQLVRVRSEAERRAAVVREANSEC